MKLYCNEPAHVLGGMKLRRSQPSDNAALKALNPKRGGAGYGFPSDGIAVTQSIQDDEETPENAAGANAPTPPGEASGSVEETENDLRLPT